MLAEKTTTAQTVIDKITPGAPKVDYVSDLALSEALLELEHKGLPTNKHEDYKYCNLDAVLRREFKNISQQFNTTVDVAPYRLPGTHTLVVLNGNYSEALSDKPAAKEVSIVTLSAIDAAQRNRVASLADVKSDPFIALNTAFSSDGFFMSVQKGAALSTPFHILYISSSASEAFVNARNFIELGENAEATIIEEQIIIGEGKVFTNFLSEKLLAPNARLRCVTIQNEGGKGFSVNANQVSVDRGANYSNTTITLSGQVVRNNHNVALVGEHCEAHLFGLFSLTGTQLVDNHTLVDHCVPNCESNELYKGIASDKSTGVFNGKIFVRRDAQKTNAYQSSKNILLSDDATVNTKPQLEIYANDVKCSHGTSTGKIDENAMFYLHARGIGKESARKMLLASFAQEVINTIEPEALREKITELFGRGI